MRTYNPIDTFVGCYTKAKTPASNAKRNFLSSPDAGYKGPYGIARYNRELGWVALGPQGCIWMNARGKTRAVTPCSTLYSEDDILVPAPESMGGFMHGSKRDNTIYHHAENGVSTPIWSDDTQTLELLDVDQRTGLMGWVSRAKGDAIDAALHGQWQLHIQSLTAPSTCINHPTKRIGVLRMLNGNIITLRSEQGWNLYETKLRCPSAHLGGKSRVADRKLLNDVAGFAIVGKNIYGTARSSEVLRCVTVQNAENRVAVFDTKTPVDLGF